jgi:hypothetical protein
MREKQMEKKTKKEIERENNRIVLVVLLVLLTFFLTFFIFSWFDILEKEKNQISAIYCPQGDIFETADCINEYVLTFYKYNISNYNKNLTFSELKKQGGVCTHWAEFYCSIGNSSGYYTQIITFKTEERGRYWIYHDVCIWSNSQGYILFDGGNLNKEKFK